MPPGFHPRVLLECLSPELTAGGDSDAWRAVPTLQCLLVRKQVTGGKFLGLVTTEGRFVSV